MQETTPELQTLAMQVAMEATATTLAWMREPMVAWTPETMLAATKPSAAF